MKMNCRFRSHVHEVKYDGYRFQSHVRQGQVRFFTRRGHDWTAKVRNLVAPVGALKTYAAILDGEVVVHGHNGSTDFHELERELGKKDGAERLVFYLFDLLYLDGFDLRDAVLEQRKEVLARLLAQSGNVAPLVFSEHEEMDGGEMWKHACKIGLEGVVSKRLDGRYRSGRLDTWLKAPCKLRDTFVIAGWALKGREFDGFYLGEERRGKLVYAGKIESGWTEDEKKQLLAEVRPLQRRTPAIELVTDKPKAHWVEPRVLVDVEYRAKTDKSSLLRHPRFKGVRRDLMEPSWQRIATKGIRGDRRGRKGKG